MTKRALLIGSETYGLTGCNADVELMADVLRSRGFQAVATLTDGAATRAGIITGMKRLVDEIEPADAVVVYYSGHGGRLPRDDAEQRVTTSQTTHYHFVVPFDIEESAAGDFRGLLSEEMSAFQGQMTDAFLSRGATPNVTLILDCCHSGFFARATDAWHKSVDLGEKGLRLHGIRGHAQQLSAEATALTGATNPYAVRLVACQPEQSAYEMTSNRGGRHGAMTDAFASVVAGVGDRPIAWSVLADLIRRRVRARVPQQRPDVEGPSARTLFSTDRAATRATVPVRIVDDRAVIESAVLLGVDIGDELVLEDLATGAPVGTAAVDAVDGSYAVLTVSTDEGTALPDDVVAVRRTTRRPRFPVAVEVADDDRPRIERHMATSVRVRPAVGDEPVLARVEQDDGLVVLDSLGARWRARPEPAGDDGSRRIVDTLEEIALGRHLLDLPSGVGPNALDADVAVEFGVVRDGSVQPLARHGAQLAVGDRVSVTVRNRSGDELFLWIFDVGVSGRPALLTNASPSGTLLGPTGSADARVSVWSAAGEPLTWPSDVPADSTRDETFVIVLADRRGDLSGLATAASWRSGDGGWDVASLLAGGDTATRGSATPAPATPDERSAPLRYRVEEIGFFLTAPSP